MNDQAKTAAATWHVVDALMKGIQADIPLTMCTSPALSDITRAMQQIKTQQEAIIGRQVIAESKPW